MGWVVPIRESIALLPQVALSVYLRQHGQRYKVWRFGMALQISGSVLLVLLCWHYASYSLQGQTWWYALGFMLLLAFYSLGRACCSLTVKDIEADIVEKGERGGLIGNATMFSGIVTLLVAVPIATFSLFQSHNAMLVLALISALMLGVTLLIMWPIKTEVDVAATSEHKTTQWYELLPKLSSAARRFIIVRSIFVHSALVAPFFVLAQSSQDNRLPLYYLVAEALAALLSAKLWGRLSDRSARATLRVSGIFAVLACGGLLWLQPQQLWLSVGLFFILSVAHTGVRNGRKTYTLDIEEGQSRTELVGSANTFIGVVLFVVGAVYAALQPWLGDAIIAIMAAMLVLGVAMTYTLEAEKD